jgi:pyruvate kinase
MLIATLPAAHQTRLIREIIEHPAVHGVRYNVGARSPYPPRETLERLIEATERAGKLFWVDIKGRQLRIVQWAVPTFGDITLNHAIEVETPARIFFRGNEWSEIVEVRGNRLFVDPQPPSAVGQGQAVNVHGRNLKIDGYLTEDDEAYLDACAQLGIERVMLSFVEEAEDIAVVRARLPEANCVLKIESPKGLDFIRTASADTLAGCQLMAARDDLMINIGENKTAMFSALELLIKKDPAAILASRIFQGLEQKNGTVTMGDLSDLRLMETLGYRNFLLSDGLCQRFFHEAMQAWDAYRSLSEDDEAE